MWPAVWPRAVMEESLVGIPVGFVVYLCVRGAHVEDVDTEEQSHNGEGGGHTVSGAHGDWHSSWSE